MTGNLLNCGKWLALVTLMFLTFCSFAMADLRDSKGEVVLATGEVWIVSATSGERTPLRRGQQINLGDRLESAEGAATLKMVDQAILSLHPFSELFVRDYDVDTGRIRIELNQGRLDTQTGEASRQNRQGYRLNTPFAALGIRGTEYSIQVDQGQLDVYVHVGEIVLSPFSQEHLCLRDAFGPCDNPMAASLEADSGSWLQLKEGGAIRRVRGTPQFISTDLSYENSTELPRDTLFDALGKAVTPDNSIRQSLQDPLLDLTGKQPLPPTPDTPAIPNLPSFKPEGEKRYNTDLSNVSLSEETYRNLLRRITLRSYAYSTLGRTQLYNFEASLFPVRTVSMWVDPTHQRLWGQDISIGSLLDSRFWPEGRNLWSALPNNLEQMGANNFEWFNAVRENKVDLWRLPLASQALFFTPSYRIETEHLAQRYTNVWTQPIRRTAEALSGQTQPNQAYYTIKELTLQPEDSFVLTLTLDNVTQELRGKSDKSGIIFASNDQFKARGHWNNGSIILILEDRKSGQLSMNGLASIGVGEAPSAEWAERHTNAVTWGHWSNFAELSDEQRQLIQEYLGESATNKHFALAIPSITALPTQGEFDFGLSDYEAVYVNGETLLPAEITNAKLNVNFSEQQLSTRFDLTAPGLDHMHRFEAQGQFDQRGIFEANNPQTHAQAQGFIGNQGNSASFLFELPIDQTRYYSGMTHWKR